MDASTIPDIRAELAEHRRDLTELFDVVKRHEDEIAALQVRTNRHVCEPHVSQTELATLRILLRAVSNRLAWLERHAPPLAPGVPDERSRANAETATGEEHGDTAKPDSAG